MVFVEIYTKNVTFRYLNHIFEKLGVTHDLGDARSRLMARWKAHSDILFELIKLLRYLLRFRSYEAKCVQFGCFRSESTSLHSNFTETGSSPSTILGTRKRETLGYPMV